MPRPPRWLLCPTPRALLPLLIASHPSMQAMQGRGPATLPGEATGAEWSAAACAYLPEIAAALPLILSTAAPPGEAAAANRAQVLKVLRLWKERGVLPHAHIESALQMARKWPDAFSARHPSQ